MHPASFDEENLVLDKPPNMSAEQCDALSAWRGQLDNGFNGFVTCWKPTKDELIEIQNTGRVWVIVMSDGYPPMHITGFKPFLEAS
jgi:hypothetical protein